MNRADNRRFRIFILGAGFSKHAGLPLGPELWQKIRSRAQLLPGRAAKFQSDLESYIDYRRDCDGCELTPDDVDFEDFCGFLDIEHFLGLRGSDTWSDDGNEGTIVIKTLIGQILAEITPSSAAIPELYKEFAERLEPDDYLLTFNYDNLLERALDAIGKPYRLFSDRYTEVGEYGATVDSSFEEVTILKLHGSIDWFDRGQYSATESVWANEGLTSRPSHPVFGPSGDRLGAAKLLDGPRHPDDPLNTIYRVKDVEGLYQRELMFRATPWLLAPSSLKILYSSKFGDFCRGLGRAGIYNFGLAIIGYSLPKQDECARQVVYSIVTNYQTAHWEDGVLGKKKTPLVIVDSLESPGPIEDFKNRYRFVNWDRATTHWDGFDHDSLALIFDE